MPHKVLILGGTEDSLRLHALLSTQGIDAQLSLAGRTRLPASLPEGTRIGGFGGAGGLADFLREGEFVALIDATHPFALRISKNGSEAAASANVPHLRLVRPPWATVDADQWIIIDDETEAAAALPAGAQVFLALGAQKLGPFAARADVNFVIRVVDPPATPLLPFPHEVVTDRGPFTLEGEIDLLSRHRVSHIVARNSGGVGAAAKLEAARSLHLPVLMIARPEVAPGPVAQSADEACAWVIEHLG